MPRSRNEMTFHAPGLATSRWLSSGMGATLQVVVRGGTPTDPPANRFHARPMHADAVHPMHHGRHPVLAVDPDALRIAITHPHRLVVHNNEGAGPAADGRQACA